MRRSAQGVVDLQHAVAGLIGKSPTHLSISKLRNFRDWLSQQTVSPFNNSVELSGSLPRLLKRQTRFCPKSGHFEPTPAIGVPCLSVNFRSHFEAYLWRPFDRHYRRIGES